ncbi:hypothetical protein PHMEG_00039001 [Phytophthora megakarya]|uniref:Uncharacterized protein n=1 Tax=Phytophthora megakarya TaxID=4795 RepID=A0A225UGE7_9STRA|nr:hypothetical protein PHMEG_00039001 [Phytophthora megakarya]
MLPAQMTHPWHKISAIPMSTKSFIFMRRRLRSKTLYLHFLNRLLIPRRMSKCLSTFAQRFAMAKTTMFQTPGAKFTDELWEVLRMQMETSELLVSTSIPQQFEMTLRHNFPDQNGLVDKAVAWILAPIFFGCVVVEQAKPPKTWEATEIFSRIVVSFMLKLFVLVTSLTAREQRNLIEKR